MKRLTVILTLALPMAANAQVFEVTATAAETPSFVNVEDFTVVFNDTSGDGLFQVEELVSFSGFTATFDGFPGQFLTVAQDTILGTTAIPGVSGISGINTETDFSWFFETLVSEQIFLSLEPGDTIGFGDSFWTFENRTVEPVELIEELQASVSGLFTGRGPESLLTQAGAFAEAGDTAAACAMLNAFTRQVNAAVRSNRLSEETANELLSLSALAEGSIGCD